MDGDAQAARIALETALQRGEVKIRRMGRDHYGRTLGAVYAANINLSCAMLATGHAVYRASWDNGGTVARDCPRLAR